MSVQKKKVSKKLKSRDPFIDLKRKNPVKLKVCDISVTIKEGKTKKVKNLGSVFFKVSRATTTHYNYSDNNYNLITLPYYTFRLFAKRNKRTKEAYVGSFSATLIDGVACISSSNINEEAYVGIGVGKKSYEVMAAFFRVLQSDPGGCTSTDAARVWKSMKAKRISKNRNIKSMFRVISNKKVKVI